MLLAFVAGFVTLLNPCVLPILPILLGAAIAESRFGPLAFAGGLVVSFSVFGMLILTVGYSIGLDQGTVRFVTALILMTAGLILIIPQAQTAFAAIAAPIASSGGRLLERLPGQGISGQFLLGGLIGIVWTPCVGPTLGVAIAAASQGDNLLSSFITFVVFGMGVALSLLAFAYSLRGVLATRKALIQRLARWSRLIFGAALVLVGMAILTGLDKMAEAAMLDMMPDWLVAFTTRF